MLIYLERVVQLLSGILITYWLVNHFTADDYGVYRYILSISSLLVMVSLLGFNAANVRYIPEYIAKDKDYLINHQVKAYFLIQLAVFALITILVGASIWAEIVDVDQRVIVTVVLLIAFFNYIKSYIGESLHVAFSKRQQLTKIRIFLNVVQLAIIYVFISSEESSIQNLQYYLAFYSSVEVVALLYGVRLFYKRTTPGDTSSPESIKHTLNYASYNYGFTWVNFLRDNAATSIMVAYLFSFKEVALYAVALIIPNIIRNFTPSKVFSGLIIPIYIKQHIATGNSTPVFAGMSLMARLNVLYLIPACLYSIYLYQWIIGKYFGAEYSNSTYWLSLFLFANVAILSYVDLGAVLLNILDKASLLFKVNILSATNILFLYLLHSGGVLSIGVSNLLSTMLTVGFLYIFIVKVFGKPIATGFECFHIFRYALFIFVGFFLLFQLGEVLFLTLAPLYAAFIFIVIVRSTYFDNVERAAIRNALPKMLGDKIYG